jgi:hypothetical protein
MTAATVLPFRKPTGLVDRTQIASGIAGDPRLIPVAVRVGVLLALKFLNGQTGRCDPGIGTLSRQAGVCRRQVLRGIEDLERNGWLQVQRRLGIRNAYVIQTSDTEVTGDMQVTGDAEVTGPVTPKSPSSEHRKERGKKGADAPPTFKSDLWKSAKRSVSRLTGKPEDTAGRLIGSWVKQYGMGPVIEAIAKAETTQPAEPVSWIIGTLRAARGQPTAEAPRQVPKGEADRILTEGGMADAEPADRNAYLRSKGIDPRSAA